MSEEGNGQGCDCKYLTFPQTIPASSRTSRRTASSIVSPGSTKPARHDQEFDTNRPERPRMQRSAAVASMITTGSVRGKCCISHEGQSRRQPASTTMVGNPQFEQ